MSRINTIILDRDGVINHDSPDYIKSPEEWVPVEGSLDAIALICTKGYSIYIATNQSGIARGLYNVETLEAIHRLMISSIESAGGSIKRIFLCPHGPDAHCRCRKPAPGMLLDIFSVAGVNAEQCLFVGDSLRDLQAARAAGCPAALVETGNGLRVSKEDSEEVPRFADLLTLAHWLPVRQQSPDQQENG